MAGMVDCEPTPLPWLEDTMRLPTKPCLLTALLTMVAGCADYEFRVNEKVVYTPVPLFANYDVQDEGLAGCIAQTIEDEKITRAEELRVLRCTHAGIVSLVGLEVFGALQVLQLQHNDIGSVQGLRQLLDLEQLDLRDNRVRSAAGLETLSGLYQLDLRDNPELDCQSLAPMARNKKLDINLPEQCP